MNDLKERGLLDTTLIVWMGEFGRTPKINPQNGRDHFANAWRTVLAGGGIKGGQVFGKTSADGMTVKENPVVVPELRWPRSARRWASTRPSRTCPTSAGPSAWPTPGAKPIKEVLA